MGKPGTHFVAHWHPINSAGINGHATGNDWLEVPTIEKRPIFQAYVREYPHKIWPYMVGTSMYWILEWPLIWGIYILGKKKGMISTSLLGFRSIAGEKSHIYLQVLLAYALGVAQNNFLIYVGWHIATHKEIEKCVWTIDDICTCSHHISRVLTFLSILGVAIVHVSGLLHTLQILHVWGANWIYI